MSGGDALELSLPARPVPAPAPALMQQVRAARPVRLRRPGRTWLLVAMVALAYPLYAFSVIPVRADLPGLPVGWFVAVGLLWLVGFVALLSAALLPPSGQVLPRERWSGTLALLAATVLIATGLLFTVDAAGQTIVPAATWEAFVHNWWHCISFSGRIVLPVLVAGLLALRRFAPLGMWKLGAAMGAAGGAMAGLTLHGLCPIGGGLHVGLAHGGAVALGALLGWGMLLVGHRLLRNSHAPRA
jgi:hypothetical protein